MRNIYLFILVLFSVNLTAQEWVDINQYGSAGQESLKQIATSISGNIWVGGIYTQSFDGLPHEGQEDIFCFQYDASDNLLNTITVGGDNEEDITGLAVDGHEQLLISGSYILNTNIDTISFSSSLGNKGLFVAQFGLDNQVRWAKNIEVNILSVMGEVVVDSDNNIIATGHFYNTLQVDGITLNANSTEGDIFIIKWDNDGNLIWVRQAGVNGISRSKGIDVAPNDDIIIGGSFFGEININGNIIQTNTADNDVFIIRLNSGGNFLWGKKFGGVLEDEFGGLDVDEFGNTYLSGYFLGVFRSGDGWEIQTTGFNQNTYVVKLDINGNVLWGKSLGDTDDDFATDISEKDGKLAITGYYTGVTGWEGYTISSQGSFNGFLGVMDGNGNVLNLENIGSNGFSLGNIVKYDINNQILLGFDFNPDFELNNILYSSNGNYDAAWVRSTSLVKNEELIELNNNLFYPNPCTGILFSNDNFKEIKIFNSVGEEIKNTNGKEINLNNFPSGIYFIKTEKGMQKINLIK